MSADDIADFYVHTAVVEPFEGTNGYGEDIYSAPVILDPADTSVYPGGNGCWLDDTRHYVRTSDTEQILSSSTLYTYPGNAALFPPKSRVTVNGNTALVIKTNPNDSGDLDLPDHVAVSLT